MDRKRARLQNSPWHFSSRKVPVGHAGASQADAEVADISHAAGVSLRKELLTSYAQGKMPATQVSLLAHYVTEAGGCGVEDIGIPPSRERGHAEHLNAILARECSLPDLYGVSTPLFAKASCRREQEQVLVNLPTRALAQSVVEVSGPANDFGPQFDTHPAVVRARLAGLQDHQIRPIGLYWDGVLYNRKQTFCAMYFVDFKTGVMHLAWLVRRAPSLDDMFREIIPRLPHRGLPRPPGHPPLTLVREEPAWNMSGHCCWALILLCLGLPLGAQGSWVSGDEA